MIKLQLPRYTNDHKLGEWIQSWEQGVSFLVSRVIETNIEHDLISMFDTINRWRIKAASEVTSQKVFYCSQNWIRQIKHALYCLVSRGDLRFIGRGLTGTPWWGGHEVWQTSCQTGPGGAQGTRRPQSICASRGHDGGNVQVWHQRFLYGILHQIQKIYWCTKYGCCICYGCQ